MSRKLIYLVLALSVALISSANAQDPNLVGWWTLDDGEGTVAADSSGNGYDGTVVGAAWIEGIHGSALDLHGNVYVDIPAAAWSTIKMQFTCAVWLYGDPVVQPQSNFTIAAFQDPANNNSREFSCHVPWSGGVVYFDTGWDGTAYDRINKTATAQEYAGDWKYWVFTKDASTGNVAIYLDGQPWHSGTEKTKPITGITKFTLGCRPDITNFYTGLMDDVKLYNRALSAEEVKALFYRPGAYSPNPADGAVEVDTTSLEWKAGTTAVSHKIYLSTDETIDESDLSGQTDQPKHDLTAALTPGATYYWRVDEIDADGNVFTGSVWSFGTLPLEAHFESPYDGQGNVLLDAQLSWTPGKGAILHNVYFGTDPQNLQQVSPMQQGTTYAPAALEAGTTYYWRVDEFVAPATNVGPVWSFTTLPANVPALIDDPNLVGYWTFDEGAHRTALDYSGNNRFGVIRGDAKWVPGYEGSALELDGNGDYVSINGYKGILADASGAQQPFTVTAWVKTTDGGDRTIASWGTNSNRLRVDFRLALGRLRVEHGGGNVVGSTALNDDNWHHVALTMIRGATVSYPDVQLWLDGKDDTTPSTTAAAFSITAGVDMAIGYRATAAARYFLGAIDDVRLYDRVLTAEEFTQVMRIDKLDAWSPSPANRSSHQLANVTALSWTPGDSAILHAVNFGTDPEALIPVTMQQDTSYILPQAIEIGQTYYWRVDELNADGTTATGKVWKFTIDPFIVVDNVESYTDTKPDRIFDAWADGWLVQTNGSIVGHPRPNFEAGEHFVETGIVHGGAQSMPYFYDNFYRSSAATLALDYPRDWTAQGVGQLSLWFRGDAANVAEPMYVAIANAGSNAVTVYNEDPNAALTGAWTNWVIDLQQFEGVDLTNVDSITIGFGQGEPQAGGLGLVFFDDIALYPKQ